MKKVEFSCHKPREPEGDACEGFICSSDQDPNHNYIPVMKISHNTLRAVCVATVAFIGSSLLAGTVSTTYDSSSQKFVLSSSASSALNSAESTLGVANSPVVWNLNPRNRQPGDWAGQCVAFTKEVRSDLNVTWGGYARDGITKFAKTHRIDQVPQVGSAFVWPSYTNGSGIAGHTGIITKVKAYRTSAGVPTWMIWYEDSNRKGTELFRNDGYQASIPVSGGSSSWKFIHDTNSNYAYRLSIAQSALNTLYNAGFLNNTSQGSYVPASTFTNDTQLLSLLMAGADSAPRYLCEVVRACAEELNRGLNISDVRYNLIERLNGTPDSTIRSWMRNSSEWSNVRAGLGGGNSNGTTTGQLTVQQKMTRLFDAMERAYPSLWPAYGRQSSYYIDNNNAYRYYSNGNYLYISNGTFWYMLNNQWTNSNTSWTQWYSWYVGA